MKQYQPNGINVNNNPNTINIHQVSRKIEILVIPPTRYAVAPTVNNNAGVPFNLNGFGIAGIINHFLLKYFTNSFISIFIFYHLFCIGKGLPILKPWATNDLNIPKTIQNCFGRASERKTNRLLNSLVCTLTLLQAKQNKSRQILLSGISLFQRLLSILLCSYFLLLLFLNELVSLKNEIKNSQSSVAGYLLFFPSISVYEPFYIPRRFKMELLSFLRRLPSYKYGHKTNNSKQESFLIYGFIIFNIERVLISILNLNVTRVIQMRVFSIGSLFMVLSDFCRKNPRYLPRRQVVV